MKIYRLSIVTLTVIMAMALSIPAMADSYTDTIAIYKKAPAVQPFFKSAYGYAVFPTIGKGGFVSVAHTEKGKYIRVAKSRAKHL